MYKLITFQLKGLKKVKAINRCCKAAAVILSQEEPKTTSKTL
jgi:hypothetical protein